MKAQSWIRASLCVFLWLAAVLPLSGQTTFSNNAGITINDASTASPYPSTILVSGLTGTISDVNVTLTGFTHAFPDDVGILLVGPTGVAIRLMTDAGGGAVSGASNVTMTFDDSALISVPDEGPIVSGQSYKPTAGTQDLLSGPHPANFAAPAPVSPYSSLLSSLNGTNANGTWKLFADDDTAVDGGTIGGWSITITTTAVPEPSTWMLLSIGAVGLVGIARRRMRKGRLEFAANPANF